MILASNFPNQVDQIDQFEDMTSNDALNVKNFQTAIQSGDFATASNIFNQIPNANNKFIGAVRMNQIRDSVLAIEKFYGTDVRPYIELKQQEWTNIVNLFSYIDNFNITTQYRKNNMVLYVNDGLSQLYINIFQGVTPIGTLPTNVNYFRVLTIKGQKGESGIGSAFLFGWLSSTHYNSQDIVVFNNSWWVATQPNQNQQPQDGSLYWNLVLTATQAIYPIQPNEPISQAVGEIWFKVI